MAIIGTIFFQWLPADGWADSTEGIVWVSLACYAVSSLVAFLLAKEAREGAELAWSRPAPGPCVMRTEHPPAPSV